MHACNVIADIAVLFKNHAILLFFLSINEIRNDLLGEIESSKNHTRHYIQVSRVYFQ